MRALLIVAAIVAATVVSVGSGAAGLAVAGATSPAPHRAATHASGSHRHAQRASRKKVREAFRACLSAHGVTSPTHPASGAAGSPAKASGVTTRKEASSICRALLPKAARPHGRFGRHRSGHKAPTASQQAALSTYEQCMASHGVQIVAGSTITTIRRLRSADPAAASANKQCHSDLRGAFEPSGMRRAR